MSQTKRKYSDRVLSMFLVLVMLLGMLPVRTQQVFAQTAEYPDVFTFTVTDADGVVDGAEVKVTAQNSATNQMVEETQTTDVNGVVAFPSLTELGQNGDTVQVDFTVLKNGYENFQSSFSLNDVGISGNQNVVLTKSASGKATVSVQLNGEATVMLNGLAQPSVVVNQGEEVSVHIQPVEGAYIKNLKIDNVEVPVEKGQAYDAVLTAEQDINISAVVVKEYTVQYTADQGGTVLLNGSTEPSIKVDDGSAVKVSVNADEGYYISSVQVDGTVQQIEDRTSFNKEFVIDKDTQIAVSFVKVYTVTVEYEGEGSVVTDPEGGTVTVEAGTQINIRANPKENYRVSEVTINGEKDPSVTGENDSYYEKQVRADKNYKIVVVFAPNEFKLQAEDTENGTLSFSKDTAAYGESVKVYLHPAEEYTVDQVTVDGAKVSDVVRDDTGIWFEIKNITEDKKVAASFRKKAVADPQDLQVDATSALRQEGNLLVIPKSESIQLYTTKDGLKVECEDGSFVGNETSQQVEINRSTILTKAYLYYQAAGELYADWHTADIEDLKIVVDEDRPQATLQVTSTGSKDNYYSGDVHLKALVSDPDDYSGLQKVEYWISCDGVQSSPVVLYEYQDGQEIKNAYESEDIIVDAKTYNRANVEVVLQVTDRAQNSCTTTKIVHINTEKPAVSLDISGDQSEDAQPKYYNTNRVLTITIVDREDTFVEANATAGLEILCNGKPVELEQDAIQWENDGAKHVGQYVFSEDGAYTLSYSYYNRAGVANEEISAPTDKDIYEFVIDHQGPADLQIEYDEKLAEKILGMVTFGFYKGDNLSVTIRAKDNVAGIQKFVYSYTPEAGKDSTGKTDVVIENSDIVEKDGTYTASFEIPAQFRGEVSFAAIDKAGNQTALKDDKIIVVDTIAPGVVVEYEADEAVNEKYFAKPRKAVIRVEEANFFAEDIKDGLLCITVGKTLNDGTYTSSNVQPVFEKDKEKPDTYVAQVEFIEDADYTFSIRYEDRAGNVYDSYKMDSFVVDTTLPEISVAYDNNESKNEKYFSAGRQATITIQEHNFAAANVNATVTVNGEEDIYYKEYLQDADSWKQISENVWQATLKFTQSAAYTFAIECRDLADNPNKPVDYTMSVAPTDFVVDSNGPTDLSISYEPSFISVILEKLTFGFYQAPVKVTLKANSSTAGIEYFEYSLSLQEGASEVNSGVDKVKLLPDETHPDGTAMASFSIDPQFRGFVAFTAFDRAGNSASKADENVVVVDNIAPGITVQYDNNTAKNGKYFSADRTATIYVEEANFFQQDVEDNRLVLTVDKTLNDGTHTSTQVKPVFEKDPERADTYVAKVAFDENADYSFDICYTDRSNNVYDKYEKDEFTIDKILPKVSIEKADGAYFSSDHTARITVKEHNFDAANVAFEVNAVDVTGKDIDLSAKGYDTYLQDTDNWTMTSPDTWEAEVVFDIEGNYSISMNYVDLAGNPQESAAEDTFCVDKSNPSDLVIKYTPGFVGVLLETITFGFYKAPVNVTIEATDTYAGIDYFVYSYTVQPGASESNQGVEEQKVPAKADGSRFSATFTIDPQFRGCVSFKAFDKAQNSADKMDNSVIVVDDVAPVVEVTYDNNDSKNEKYYRSDRTATVRVTEANFFQQDVEDGKLILAVGKTSNDGEYTMTHVKPVFVKDEKQADTYVAQVVFNENADYTFDVSYTDRAGNEYNAYEMDEFTIDKILPTIDVSYDNNDCKNGDQFKEDREATIVITEHNFMAQDVQVDITASGEKREMYQDYLQDPSNWEQDPENPDKYTAKIQFTEEAHWEFDICYTDMAGNENAEVEYGDSVAPTKFTLDKSKPTEMDIRIDDVSVVGSMETVAFDKFYDKKVVVKLSANCDISGKESFLYQKVANAAEYDEEGEWLNYDPDKGIEIVPSEKFILYFRAEDRAGNYDIIRTTGIVVDNQKPVGETKAPEIDILPEPANDNNLYKSDVKIDLQVLDPKYNGETPSENGYYAGLNKVTYRIYTKDTEAEEQGVLLDVQNNLTKDAVFDEDGLIYSWSGNIVVSSGKFNSNNVFVEVTAVDNAGNTRVTTTKAGQIQIDITAPSIDVRYSNNTADSSRYFKQDRTATIVITERNFNPEDVKITLTNTDGSIPALAGWTKTGAGGNQDGTTWTATLSYTADGDYTFDIQYTDMAGNKCTPVSYGDSVAPTEFTIDKTTPVVTVEYDNNNARSGNYYNKTRTATVTIVEHNLEPNGADRDRVKITMTAVNDGADVANPAVGTWSTNGNVHTATITFREDAHYTFDIAVMDKAGNEAEDYAQDDFYVDQTAPTLQITGVENGSANKGDVMPVISYSDVNYDPEQVSITLHGANRQEVQLKGAYTDIHNGRTFTFENFAKEKEIDDIYTLTAALVDKAGNETKETIHFSVNRFGSTYVLSESTKKMNGSYVQKASDVVVTEINANSLTNIKITLFKNNETLLLKEGVDYKIDVKGGNGQWYQYVYTVFAHNFEEDGVYRLVFHSEDLAGNVAENTLDTKDTEVMFGVDKTKPNLVVANLESGVTYALDRMTVEMSAKDNLLLKSITVYLDDYDKAYQTWNADEIAAIIANNESFNFEILGSTNAHKLKIVCVDAAGNEYVEEITDFFVTTNLFVRYYNNKPLFFGSIIGIFAIIGCIIFVVYRKRKKEESKVSQ